MNSYLYTKDVSEMTNDEAQTHYTELIDRALAVVVKNSRKDDIGSREAVDSANYHLKEAGIYGRSAMAHFEKVKG